MGQFLRTIFKNRPIYFHINSTIIIDLVKQTKLSFSSNETNKPLPDQVYSVSYVRSKFRSPILVAATDLIPDHTQSRVKYHQHRS